MKHTPGPWSFHANDNYLYINGGNKETICTLSQDVTPSDYIGFGSVYKPFDNYQHNANLIAAAPELLEALKMATYDYEAMSSRDWEHIKELIEKAEGR